jgi:hypothetical protein
MRQSAAPLPPAKMLQPGDLPSLAGDWEGDARFAKGAGDFTGPRASVKLTVAPDGSYTSNMDGNQGVGKASIQNGRVVFQGTNTKGTATLHEGDGRRVLKGEGSWVGRQGETAFELTKK